MPVTSITYQWKYNKSYISPHLQTGRKIYGEYNTKQLQQELIEDLVHTAQAHRIVSMINDPDYENLGVLKIVETVTGETPCVTQKTNTKRSYYWEGLTIHEED